MTQEVWRGAGEPAFLTPRRCRCPWSSAVILSSQDASREFHQSGAREFSCAPEANIYKAISAEKDKFVLHVAFSLIKKHWGMGAFSHKSYKL